MKRIYYFKSSILCTMFCTAIFATSCVDSAYDLDKDIELDMHIGGELTAPIGKTKSTALRDVLSTDEIKYLEEMDGAYKISMSDSFEVEIDKITDEDITLKLDEQSIDPITFAFEKPAMPSFTMPPFTKAVTIDNQANGSVDLGSGLTVNEQFEVNANLGSVTIPSIGGITVSDVAIPVATSGGNVFDLYVGDDISCPKAVTSISNIELGSVANFSIDLSALANRFSASTFSLEMDYLEIRFPAGFVLDGGSNVVRFTNLKSSGKYITKSFVLTSYDKVVNVTNGKIDPIGGEVEVVFADECRVSGTTIANSESSTALRASVTSSVAVADMDIALSGYEVAIDDMALGEPFTIDGIPSSVESVQSVTLDDATNVLYIGITPFALPAGLSVAEQNMNLLFPKALFNMSEWSYDKDYVAVKIPVSSVVGGAGFSDQVAIHSLKLDQIPVVGGSMSIAPGVILRGATLVVGGTTTYRDFNSFVANKQSITTSVTTNGMIKVADAELTLSSDAFSGEIEPYESEIAPAAVVIPDELVRIDSLHFTSAVMAPINVKIPLEGINAELAFDNLKIEFPRFIRFRDAEQHGIDKDNVMILNDKFAIEKDNDPYTDDYGVHTFNKVLYVDALDFSSYDFDSMISTNSKGERVLEFKDMIKISGGLALSGEGGGSPSVSLDDLQDEITADISFDIMEDMVVEDIYGVVDPVIETEPQVVDLSELGEAFDGELTASLTSPTITLTASNTLAIPVVIDKLELQPSKGGEELTAATLAQGEKIIIAAAAGDGAPRTTKIVISADDAPANGEAGVEYVKIDNLKTLLNNLPDKIVFDYHAAAYADDNTNHMVNLSQESYLFAVDYQIDVPLEFDAFELDYSVVIEDCGESIGAIADYISSLDLELTAQSTLPVDLTIAEITPLDAAGAEITSIPSIVDAELNSVAANTTSLIKASLRSSGEELAKVDKLRIAIKASISSTQGGAALLPDQSFSFDMVARIPDGVMIEIDTDDDND